MKPIKALPEGFTTAESSVVRGYKYNPGARELEIVVRSGQHYIYGDVSPEEAEAIESGESKGRAFNRMKSQHPLVAKVIGGKREAFTSVKRNLAQGAAQQ